MKKHLHIILILVLIVACNTKKNDGLKNKISELEKQNAELKDSITTLNYKKISNSITIGIRDDSILKVGRREKIKFIFHYPEKLFSYNVYTTDSIGSPDKLIKENLTKNEFEYEFIPTKTGQETVELIAVFNIKNQLYDEIIEVPIIAGVTTTE